MAFRSFISHHFQPKMVLSDNATTFLSAARTISIRWKSLKRPRLLRILHLNNLPFLQFFFQATTSSGPAVCRKYLYFSPNTFCCVTASQRCIPFHSLLSSAPSFVLRPSSFPFRDLARPCGFCPQPRRSHSPSLSKVLPFHNVFCNCI